MFVQEKLVTIYMEKARSARRDLNLDKETAYRNATRLVNDLPQDHPVEIWVPMFVSKLINLFRANPQPEHYTAYKECVLIAESFIGND